MSHISSWTARISAVEREGLNGKFLTGDSSGYIDVRVRGGKLRGEVESEDDGGILAGLKRVGFDRKTVYSVRSVHVAEKEGGWQILREGGDDEGYGNNEGEHC
jgi:hypothetical protein